MQNSEKLSDDKTSLVISRWYVTIQLMIDETNEVHFVGKLDKDIYKCITEDIVTDEVIITDERADASATELVAFKLSGF